MVDKEIVSLVQLGVCPRVLDHTLTLFHPLAAQRALTNWAAENGLLLSGESKTEFGGVSYTLSLMASPSQLLLKTTSDTLPTLLEASADAALAMYYHLIGWDINIDSAWPTPADLARIPDPALEAGAPQQESMVTLLSLNDGSGRCIATVKHLGRTSRSSRPWLHAYNAIREAAHGLLV